MFAQKGVELVQELERAKDFLPPFNVTTKNITIFLIIVNYVYLKIIGRWSSTSLGRNASLV